MSFRLSHRQDANAGAIVSYFEAHGATYQQIDQPVDGIVCYCGVMALVEIKQPKAKLRPNQERFLENWPGLCAVVRSEADADVLLLRLRNAASGESDWRL